LDHNLIVLILTQPESWAQFNDRGELVVGDVPILTQPESWAQYSESRSPLEQSSVPILTQPESWAQ